MRKKQIVHDSVLVTTNNCQLQMYKMQAAVGRRAAPRLGSYRKYSRYVFFLTVVGFVVMYNVIYCSVLITWYDKAMLLPATGCGDVCSFNVRDRAPGRFYPLIMRDIVCDAVIDRMKVIDPGSIWPPPRFPSSFTMAEMTHHGQLPLRDVSYFPDEEQVKEAALIVGEEVLAELQQWVQEGRAVMLGVPPSAEAVFRSVVRDKHEHIEGAVVFTLGRKNPFVEAILLAENPRKVVSVEYQVPFHEIVTENTQVSAKPPLKIAFDWAQAGQLPMYNFGVAFFSVGQLGFGIYGERLNPWADFEAMAQAWCLTKSGGYFVLVVNYEYKNEYLVWNSGRVYSTKRMQYLTANWEVQDMRHLDSQPTKDERHPGWALWVLKKP